MPVRRIRRSPRCLWVCVLALLLASGLAACNGPSEDAPAPAEPDPVSISAPPVSSAETPPPPIPPDAPVPEPPAAPVAPGEPPVPDAPTPPATATSEPPPPVESPTGEPSAATDEAETQSFRYDTYDLSGAVSEPGHYAFLADPADPVSVVTTYEGLRDGTATTLLIHTHDAHGISQVDLYDAVEAGDLVEWKRAADCFVRYTVTSALTPAAGAVTRAFGVAWMTYAFTGCSGSIAGEASGSSGSSTTTTVDVTWGTVLPVLGGTSLTTPIRHGSFQIVPQGMTSVAEKPVLLPHTVMEPSRTENLAEARRLPRWRDPALPAGWRFGHVVIGPSSTPFGYAAKYLSPQGGIGLSIHGQYASERGRWEWAFWRPNGSDLGVNESRLIAGRPAIVSYSPGPNVDPYFPTAVWIYDAATESEYVLYGKNLSLRGPNIEALIAIARSLFEPPNAP